MKNLFLFFLIILYFIPNDTVRGQDVLVDGAEWHYSLIYFSSPNLGVNRCYIDGETMIQDRNCLIYHQDHTNCNGRPAITYLHKSDDRIYYYDEEVGEFKLLYDFSLDVGDTMEYETTSFFADEKVILVVDSIGTFEAHDRPLKKFYVRYGIEVSDGEYYFETHGDITDIIIEGIGNTHNFFHLSDNGWCDYQISYNLRCFSSVDYPRVKFGQLDCLFTPVENLDKNPIRIYPNPFNAQINIENLETNEKAFAAIYNNLGHCIKRQIISSRQSQLDLSNLPPATYMLIVYNRNQNEPILVKIIIKNE